MLMMKNKIGERKDLCDWKVIDKDGNIYHRNEISLFELKNIVQFSFIYEGRLEKQLNIYGCDPLFYITTCGVVGTNLITECFVNFGYKYNNHKVIFKFDLIEEKWL